MLRNLSNTEGNDAALIFRSPRQQKIVDLWLQIALARPPARTDFPPEVLKHNLGYIAIVEHNQNACFHFRLAGTELVRRARKELTGLSFEQLYTGDQLVQLNALFSRTLAFGRPHRAIGSLAFGLETTTLEVALLPVCSTGARQFSQVLAIFAFLGTVPEYRSKRAHPLIR